MRWGEERIYPFPAPIAKVERRDVLGNWTPRRSIPDNGTVIDDTKITTAGDGEMQGTSRPSKWMWLLPLVFLVLLVLELVGGQILPTLGFLCLLVNGVLVASGLYTRSRALLYLTWAVTILGLLFLAASIVRGFS